MMSSAGRPWGAGRPAGLWWHFSVPRRKRKEKTPVGGTQSWEVKVSSLLGAVVPQLFASPLGRADAPTRGMKLAWALRRFLLVVRHHCPPVLTPQGGACCSSPSHGGPYPHTQPVAFLPRSWGLQVDPQVLTWGHGMKSGVLGCGTEGGSLSTGPESGCRGLAHYGLGLPRGNPLVGKETILGKREGSWATTAPHSFLTLVGIAGTWHQLQTELMQWWRHRAWGPTDTLLQGQGWGLTPSVTGRPFHARPPR